VTGRAHENRARLLAAGAVGNLLEWYDFAIYGYFAPQIGRAFFPHADPVAQLLAAFGVFAAGYLVRPLGGALVGHIGDRHGRRAALVFSIAAMSGPTFLVGLLPGYATLGLAAPILLTLLRCLQGLSAGGEWTTSFIFLIEQAPAHRRGLFGAIGSSGGICGILLGSASAALLASILPPAALDDGGWRLPFLLGLLAGIAGWILRRGLSDVAERQPAPAEPLLGALRDHPKVIARVAGIAAFAASGLYLMFLYIVSWLQSVDRIPPERALDINTASMAALIPVELAAGWLSDRLGARSVLLAALGLAAVGALPLLWLMHQPSTAAIVAGQLGFVLTIGTVLAVQPAFIVAATPAALRCTTVGLGYNITLASVGGLSPLAAAWLVHRSGLDLSPAGLVTAAAVVSIIAVLWAVPVKGASADAG
jgi:MFS transporter, MHS family, proline/betaine transporter